MQSDVGIPNDWRRSDFDVEHRGWALFLDGRSFSSLARNLHHRISTSQPPPAVIHGPCGNPVTPPWENDGHGAVGSLHSAIARCEYEPFDHEPSAGPSATNQPANTDAVPVVKSSNAAAEGLALDMDVMSEGVRDRWLD